MSGTSKDLHEDDEAMQDWDLQVKVFSASVAWLADERFLIFLPDNGEVSFVDLNWGSP